MIVLAAGFGSLGLVDAQCDDKDELEKDYLKQHKPVDEQPHHRDAAIFSTTTSSVFCAKCPKEAGRTNVHEPKICPKGTRAGAWSSPTMSRSRWAGAEHSGARASNLRKKGVGEWC